MDGLCPSLSAKTCFANSFNKFEYKILPPERIELSTPGLQDQCSATELKRLFFTIIESLIDILQTALVPVQKVSNNKRE